jgi:tRNA(Arg) A34 adenosine deaminase TadA
MNIFLEEKDAIVFLGLLAIAFRNFDQQFRHTDGELTHTNGLNIFAAIIDNYDGEVIAQEQNRIHSQNNPMLHAEQETLKEAIAYLNKKRPRPNEISVENYYRKYLFNQPNTEGNFDVGGTIYTTLEPCPFCTSALLVNRMKRIVYIIPDKKYGNSIQNLKSTYYSTYDITYQQIFIHDNPKSRIMSFAKNIFNDFNKYFNDNPNLPGTLFFDNLQNELKIIHGTFLGYNLTDLITEDNDKDRNFETLKGLQLKAK